MPEQTSERPSETLRRAADLIEERARDATPGPWFTHDGHLGASGGHTATVLSGEPGVSPELRAWLPTFNADPWDNSRRSFTDARWIAMLSPAVAPHLVLIFREMATAWADAEDDPEPRRMALGPSRYGRDVLALARAILGEPVEVPHA